MYIDPWNLTTKRISQPHSTAVFSNRPQRSGEVPPLLEDSGKHIPCILASCLWSRLWWLLAITLEYRPQCFLKLAWFFIFRTSSLNIILISINKDWLFDAKISQERKCKQCFTNAKHCSIPGRKNTYKLARQGTSATSMIKRDPANDCEIFKQSRGFIFDEESKGMNMAVPFNSSICLCLRPWVCWSSSHAHSWDSLCQQGFWRLPADQGLCHMPTYPCPVPKHLVTTSFSAKECRDSASECRFNSPEPLRHA